MLRTLRLVLLSGGSLLAFATFGTDDRVPAEPVYVQSYDPIYAPGGYATAPATSGWSDELPPPTTHGVADPTTGDGASTDADAETLEPAAHGETANPDDL